MHKNATKCNKTLSKWCKNKHGASKIIDTFETYHSTASTTLLSCQLRSATSTTHLSGRLRSAASTICSLHNYMSTSSTLIHHDNSTAVSTPSAPLNTWAPRRLWSSARQHVHRVESCNIPALRDSKRVEYSCVHCIHVYKIWGNLKLFVRTCQGD
jgi:hypothetical protein